MMAIVKAESGGNPLAIGVNRGGVRPGSPGNRNEAIAAAAQLLRTGANFDLGLAQINSANLSWLGLSIEGAFDPCLNIEAAAKILSSNYRRAIERNVPAPLGAALSAYNTGSMSRGYANGYVAKVSRAATELPADEMPEATEVQSTELPEPPRWDVFAYQAWLTGLDSRTQAEADD